jgi:hypothetical protein
MFSRSRWYLLLVLLMFLPAVGQQTSASPPAQRPPSPGFAAQAWTASSSPDTAAVMELAQKIAAATVRGDAAYVGRVTSPDFTIVYDDGWVMGGRPRLVDDKKGFLDKIKNKKYLAHDLDPTSVRFEMHGDIAVVYGRYLSQTKSIGAKDELTSVWFEQVYQKRAGQWIYLSDRTIHGPTTAPGGIDPTAVGWDSGATGSVEPTSMTEMPIPEALDPTVSKSPVAATIIAFEKAMEAGVVRGDTAFVDNALSPDFIMVHGDIWVRGGKPVLADDKQSFLPRVTNKQYLVRDLDSVKVEMHGDVAITYGQYVAQSRIGNPARSWFSVWFERVYAKRDGKWFYVSHRTVHGPTYGPTRESIADK